MLWSVHDLCQELGYFYKLEGTTEGLLRTTFSHSNFLFSFFLVIVCGVFLSFTVPDFQTLFHAQIAFLGK